MKITTVTVHLSQKKSENYQSKEVAMGVTVELEEGETATTVIRNAREFLKREINLAWNGNQNDDA